MRPAVTLALDAALAGCSAGVVIGGETAASRSADGARGNAALLPAMALAVLGDAGLPATGLDLIAVTVGPGSFTGLRAALSLAHGLALGAGVALVGVSVGEALAEAVDAEDREFWTAIDSRRGRVFLERAGHVTTVALNALPSPDRPVVVAGDAAVTVAATLAARDLDVLLAPARRPSPRDVARAAERRLSSALPPRPAQPLYVDPPEARPIGAGSRPAPNRVHDL